MMIPAELTAGIIQAATCLFTILCIAVVIVMATLLFIVFEYIFFGNQYDGEDRTGGYPDPSEYDITPYEEDDEDNVIFNR